MARITLENVSKTYQHGPAAVRNLTLAIEHGELVVLVGPSGCGKSTILRLIAGLEAPSAGRILLDDQDVTSVPAQARDVAMVFQSYALYPHKTVRQNLAFGLRMRKLAPAEIEPRIDRVALVLGITDLLDRKPAQLSGGQRQRVALGRAIVREPRAFLLDEPLSNLDPQLRVEARTELRLLHRRLGATLVHVTHDQEEAMTLGTRLVVLRDGELQQFATPVELYRRPANTFVARFVGSPEINLFECEVTREAGGLTLSGPLGALRPETPDGGRLAAATGESTVAVGIRPHDFELVAEPDAEVRGEVEVAELLGAAQVLHVKVGAAGQTVRVLAPGDRDTRPREVVGLRVRRSAIHYFDRRTGQRIGE